ncbi:RNA polymerase sigma factor [Micromonospora sp. CA-248260]|uniref:RNA polymerase sigma factor n=1 Tax=Micromonospora sp. CA-248260 TaxID=3239962 RepID=UPI003D932027
MDDRIRDKPQPPLQSLAEMADAEMEVRRAAVECLAGDVGHALQAKAYRFNQLNRERVTEEFSAFYHTFAARLIAWLIWQGAPEADAKDVVQETMLTAYRRWNTILDPQAWARKTASRTYAKRVAELDTFPVEDPAEHVQHAASGCELAAADTKQVIRVALQKLGPRQRQMLAWYFEGHSPGEIAEQLNMSPEAVRSNLYKARKKLSELLQGHNEDEK